MKDMLLKNLLTEDPNRIHLGPGQVTTLKAKGFNTRDMQVAYFDMPGAITFILDTDAKEILYADSDDFAMTHPDMGEQIVHYWRRPKKFDLYNAMDGKGASFEPSADVDVGPGSTEGKIYTLNIKRANDLANYLQTMDEMIPLDGAISKTDPRFIMGRFWVEERVVSFWANRKRTYPYLTTIFKLVDVYGLKPNEIVYEFLDKVHLYTYDELSGEHGETRSDAEQKELMAQQHINPLAKKQLAALQGVQQKKSPGFDFQAQKDASMPALQELVKNYIPDSL
jgi:hypothetical protein